ncbi:hypothetical protein ACLOJK_031245 [Asimina triloba]
MNYKSPRSAVDAGDALILVGLNVQGRLLSGEERVARGKPRLRELKKNRPPLPLVKFLLPREWKALWGRGLDVLPTTISRFRNGGDDRTADLLETIVYREEITHCAAGIKWFKYLCLRTRNLKSIPCLTAGEKEPLEDKQASDENSAVRSPCQPSEDPAAFGGNEDEAVIHTFHATVRAYFRGPLKPPFNEAARTAAGFGTQWYEPLALKAVELK